MAGQFNQFKTILLLGMLTGLMLAVGALLSGQGGMFIAFIFAVGMNVLSYFFSHRIVLFMYQAKEASKSHYPQLHHVVEEVARKAQLPKPKVYLMQSATPNAFATGRNPEHAVVAVTTGILGLLNEKELRGVIAHEMAHIKNRDILVVTIAATIAGVISYVASMVKWAALFGGMRSDRDDGGNLVGALAIAIITPIIALLIQLAISRSREYLADETGAKFIHDSLSLASALEKLSGENKAHPMDDSRASTASMFIVNPLRGGGIMELLSTHPPLKERVARLRTMKF